MLRSIAHNLGLAGAALPILLVAGIMAGQPQPQSSVRHWSDPVKFAETSVGAAPAVSTVNNDLHVFWLDRLPSNPLYQGELWHTVLTPEGKPAIASRRVASGVDTRLAWPVALRSGDKIFAAWMNRESATVRLQVGIMDRTGSMQTISGLGPPAEESGRITMLAHGGKVHLAWSQFARGRRRIWYTVLTDEGAVDVTPHPLADGDAPALVSSGALRLLWWVPAESGTYRLVLGEISAGDLEAVDQLTGQILLVNPLPVIPLPAPEGLEVLVPTTERGFRTAGQLYLVRVKGGSVTARVPLSGGQPLSDVSATPAADGGIVLWSQAAGRRQNAEIFAATFPYEAGRLSNVSRATYTTRGSLRPAVTLANGAPVAAWLEASDIARYDLVVGTTQAAKPRRFLFGAPELDMSRPGQVLAFSVTVLLSTLPYAAFFAGAFLLASFALSTVILALVGGLAWSAPLRRPLVRLALVLLCVLAIQHPASFLIPGSPGGVFLALALFVTAVPALAVVERANLVGGMPLLVAATAVLLIQMTITLFPWGVRQLTQY